MGIREILNSREMEMRDRLLKLLIWSQMWRDSHGQDLVEYALMGGFVAVSAGALMPGVATKISTIFSKVSSVMSIAASEPISPS